MTVTAESGVTVLATNLDGSADPVIAAAATAVTVMLRFRCLMMK